MAVGEGSRKGEDTHASPPPKGSHDGPLIGLLQRLLSVSATQRLRVCKISLIPLRRLPSRHECRSTEHWSHADG
jgi:hypothetical protein